MAAAEHFLAEELERLMLLPLQSGEALRVWQAESQSLQRKLQREYSGLSVPEVVWHYLADADIRAKDSESEYRARQEAEMRKVIDALRRS